MSFKDIRFSNSEVYKLQKSAITATSLEAQLVKMTYGGQGLVKDQKVENTNFPYIVDAFFSFVFDQDKIPSESELITHYYSINDFTPGPNNIVTYLGETYPQEGLEARIRRGFPSIVRDFHFFKLCVESRLFEAVSYSTKGDIMEGVDLSITVNQRRFCVRIFVDTARSNFYKNKKTNQRHAYLKCDHTIELPINLNDKTNLKKVSNFYLLTHHHLTMLNNTITELLNAV